MARVSKDHKITFFPVGNGDTTLINLKDGTTILIDCNITKDSEDKTIEEKCQIWMDRGMSTEHEWVEGKIDCSPYTYTSRWWRTIHNL